MTTPNQPPAEPSPLYEPMTLAESNETEEGNGQVGRRFLTVRFGSYGTTSKTQFTTHCDGMMPQIQGAKTLCSR